MYCSYRQISIAGLTVLGIGKSGVVYRTGNGKMVKIYRAGFTESDMLREFQTAALMEQAGVPSMRPFEIVRCGEAFGIIYEELQGTSMLDSIFREPDKLETYAAVYGRALKTIHGAFADQDYGLSVKPLFEEKVRQTRLFSSPERARILRELERIPERLSLVHLDPTPANLLLRPDGSFAWIDLESAGTGHPVFAFQKIYFPAFVEKLPGMSSGVVRIFRQLWKDLFRNYFDDIHSAQLPGIKRSIRFLTFLNLLCSIQHFTGHPTSGSTGGFAGGSMGYSLNLREGTDMLKRTVFQDIIVGLDFDW